MGTIHIAKPPCISYIYPNLVDFYGQTSSSTYLPVRPMDVIHTNKSSLLQDPKSGPTLDAFQVISTAAFIATSASASWITAQTRMSHLSELRQVCYFLRVLRGLGGVPWGTLKFPRDEDFSCSCVGEIAFLFRMSLKIGIT